MNDDSRARTAFVLVGGGSLGAVEVGMLRVLVAKGIRPDLIVGSSVGAINGAFFAGAPGADGVQRLEAIWRGLRREHVFHIPALRGLAGLVLRRDHLADPTALRRLLERHLPYHRLEEAPVPCHVVATELLSGTQVRISSGPVVEALLASTAVPAVFPPVRIGEHDLFDGVMASRTPIATAVELGATRVIVLPTGFPCTIRQAPRGAIGMALHAVSLLIARQLVREVEQLAGKVDLAVVPPPCPLGVSSHDFSRTGELIEQAAEATLRWIEDGGLERRDVPDALRPHGH